MYGGTTGLHGFSSPEVLMPFAQPIRTDTKVRFNKPDLFIHDLKENLIFLVEIGITNDNYLAEYEREKALKYKQLQNWFRSTFRVKVNIIPVIFGYLGSFKLAKPALASIFHAEQAKDLSDLCQFSILTSGLHILDAHSREISLKLLIR